MNRVFAWICMKIDFISQKREIVLFSCGLFLDSVKAKPLIL